MKTAHRLALAFGIMVAIWPRGSLAYYGLYGGYASYASPYQSYAYPSLSAASLVGMTGGYTGLPMVGGPPYYPGLYALSAGLTGGLLGSLGLGLSSLGLYGGWYGLGLYGPTWYGLGLYGLGNLWLSGLGKEDGLENLTDLFGSADIFGSYGSSSLRSLGLQLLISGGLGNPAWQPLLLAAIFSSPLSQSSQVTAATTAAAAATANAVSLVP